MVFKAAVLLGKPASRRGRLLPSAAWADSAASGGIDVGGPFLRSGQMLPEYCPGGWTDFLSNAVLAGDKSGHT